MFIAPSMLLYRCWLKISQVTSPKFPRISQKKQIQKEVHNKQIYLLKKKLTHPPIISGDMSKRTIPSSARTPFPWRPPPRRSRWPTRSHRWLRSRWSSSTMHPETQTPLPFWEKLSFGTSFWWFYGIMWYILGIIVNKMGSDWEYMGILWGYKFSKLWCANTAEPSSLFCRFWLQNSQYHGIPEIQNCLGLCLFFLYRVFLKNMWSNVQDCPMMETKDSDTPEKRSWVGKKLFFPKVLLMFLAPSEICLTSRTTGTPRSKMSKAHQGGAGWGHTCPERQPPRAPQGDCQDHPPNGGFLVHPISSTTSSLVWDYMGLYGIIYG